MLKAEQRVLEELGVVKLTLFGSRARGDHTADSDIDLMAEFDQDRREVLTLFDLAGLAARLEKLLGHHVDLLEGPPKNALLRERIESEGVRVF